MEEKIMKIAARETDERNSEGKLWLDPIPLEARKVAVDALNGSNVAGFLVTASNKSSLDLVYSNIAAFKERGLYEEALLMAFTGTRTNNHHMSLDALKWLFEIADRQRLRNLGEPLPGQGPFTIYRGVAGRGPARRIRGLSWTGSRKRAEWFARRYVPSLPDPAVFEITVSEADVFAYLNRGEHGRNEEEFVVCLPQSARPVRVPCSKEPLKWPGDEGDRPDFTSEL